jgi:hypothetical protein
MELFELCKNLLTTLKQFDEFKLADEPLLAPLFQHVDDSMLVEISKADYGCDADAHLIALHRIRAGNIPIPMVWNPGVVLHLTCWTDPDDLTRKGISLGPYGHWMRLFACTVLIWASIEPENYDYKTEDWAYIDEDHTIVQFLDSALKLGYDTSLTALRFLGWRMQYQMQRALIDEDMGNCPCYAVAMLLLCVSLDWDKPEMVSFLISVAYSNDEYLPISKVISESLRSQKWKNLIREILLDPTAPQFAQSNSKLQKFGIMLTEHSIPE